MKKTQIIILAAGKGTRMKSDDPKALTKLKGKPFINHILDTISTINMALEPVIVIGYEKEKIIKALGEKKYAVQDPPLGTGHAVASAKDKMHPEHDTVIVLSSDQPLISRETLINLISKHKESNAVITISTALMSDFEEWRTGLRHFGRIIKGVDGSVNEIVEFKDASEKEKLIKEINLGVYAFDAKWLWENITLLKNENKQGEYYLTDLIKIARSQGEIIESIHAVDELEALQPNSKEELEILEKLLN